MKIIAFSLFGDNPIYTIGAIKNAELKQTFFADWQMNVYYNKTVPKEIIKELSEFKNVKTFSTAQDMGFVNTMWRFLPAANTEAEFFISRDLDSRISKRGEVAVEQWMKSGLEYHIIRDHPVGHGWPMNAGMWGCKGGTIPNMRHLIKNYIKDKNFTNKSLDQWFLKDVIHPMAIKSLLLHDEYYNYEGIGQAIPRDRKLDDFAFIGESVDENDEPRGDQRSSIIQRYKNVVPK